MRRRGNLSEFMIHLTRDDEDEWSSGGGSASQNFEAILKDSRVCALARFRQSEGPIMQDFSVVLDYLHAERELVISFFAGFSRFEFALINGGYAGGNNQHHAFADWIRFATALEPHFNYDRTKELRDAVDYLEAHPPNKRVLTNNVLEWHDTLDERINKSRLGCIVVHVKTARNNLFHGGKYPDAPQQPVERDKTLLRCCLSVLEELLIQSEAHIPAVKALFDQTLPP